MSTREQQLERIAAAAQAFVTGVDDGRGASYTPIKEALAELNEPPTTDPRDTTIARLEKQIAALKKLRDEMTFSKWAPGGPIYIAPAALVSGCDLDFDTAMREATQ